MKNTIIILFLILILGCKKEPVNGYVMKKKYDKSPLTKEEILNIFQRCYQNEDTGKMWLFFENWARSIKPDTQEYLNLNEYISKAYNIYLKRFDKKVNTQKYFVVQPLIYYSVMINELEDNPGTYDFQDWNNLKEKGYYLSKKLLIFCKPEFTNRDRIIYVNNEIHDAIKEFLLSEKDENGEYCIVD